MKQNVLITVKINGVCPCGTKVVKDLDIYFNNGEFYER